MDNEKKKFLLNIIIILGIVGIIASVYLTYVHYTTDPALSGVCGIGEEDPCSIVSSSKYSEILDVPAGIWGIAWFLILLYLTWKIRSGYDLLREAFSWSVMGMIFVVYFIIGEIKLMTICTYCTVVHVAVIVIFILTLMLYRDQNKKQKKTEQNIY